MKKRISLTKFNFAVTGAVMPEQQWQEFEASSSSATSDAGYYVQSSADAGEPARQRLNRRYSSRLPSSTEQSRMVDFNSGLWSLLGQVPMDDFQSENNGLSKNFYKYYRGTSKKINNRKMYTPPQAREEDIRERKPMSSGVISLPPQKDNLSASTRVIGLPLKAIKALKKFGLLTSNNDLPSISELLNIRSRPQESNSPLESHGFSPQTSLIGDIAPYFPDQHSDEPSVTVPENSAYYYGDEVASEHTPPSSVASISSLITQVLNAGQQQNGVFGNQVNSIITNVDDENQISNGANALVESSPNSPPTKYFLSASYVDPSATSENVQSISHLFNPAVVVDDELPNKPNPPQHQPPSYEDYHSYEQAAFQPALPNSPTQVIMNTVKNIDKYFDEANESHQTKPSITTFFNSNFQDQMIPMPPMTQFSENSGSSPVTVSNSAVDVLNEVSSSIGHRNPISIPSHVAEMVGNISSIIGNNPSQESIAAMVNHFSDVFKHAENILLNSSAEITQVTSTAPDQELETIIVDHDEDLPTVTQNIGMEKQTSADADRLTGISLKDSLPGLPHHVIIVYKPVLFVSHGKNDWSKVIGEGYRPAVMTETGEISEALTKEVLDTLGPDLLASLKRHFASTPVESAAPSNRKFSDTVSGESGNNYSIKGKYIIIDDENQSHQLNEFGETISSHSLSTVLDTSPVVSVEDDPGKKALAMDLVVPTSLSAKTEKNGLMNHKQDDSKPASVSNSGEESSAAVVPLPPSPRVHNIIISRSSEFMPPNAPTLSMENLKSINPAPWWLGNPSDEEIEGKKYVVRRIIKRRRKKPSKLRSKLFSQKFSTLKRSEAPTGKPFRAQFQTSPGRWRKPSQSIRKLTTFKPSSVEEGRAYRGQKPVIILEKPITDLPVDKLADMVLKMYHSFES